MTKEEAIKICKQVRKYFKGGKLDTDDTDAIYGALTEAIEALKEQKTGKWIDAWCSAFDGTKHWYRECSECEYERDDDNPDKDANYCPNCGAYMKGEENETNSNR